MVNSGPEGPRSQRGEPEDGPFAGTRNEVSGTVYGAAIQARDVSSVHIHQPSLILPSPNQLPPAVQLTGRGADIAAMDAVRESGLILITGQPGAGKSALAVHWGHGVRVHYPDGALYADLHGYAPDGPAGTSEVLGRFLRALGVDPRQVPSDPVESTDLYRSLIADRQMLVLLDDALTAAQVAPLLPSSPESLAIVTSRLRLGGLAARGARIVQLDRLDAAAALELLSRTIGSERALAERHAASELVELCGGIPLAVCVVAGRLAARPRWPVSEMVEAMTHERERLAALRLEGDLAVRGALDVSYGTLPADAARAYRLMGLFPGTHFDSAVAAATIAVPRPRAKQLLGLLADANLLDDTASGQYRFHDLTRLHAREMVEQADPKPARDEAIRRMLDWLLATAGAASVTVTPYRAGTDLLLDIRYPPAEPARFATAAPALDWLDRELPTLLAAARMAITHGQYSVAWQLADAMWPVFLARGRSSERLEFDLLGLDAARQSGEAVGEAKMLYRLGTALISAGQLDRAESCLWEARGAWQRLGRRDRAAGSLRRLGYLALVRHRPQDAAELISQAVADYRLLGDTRHVAVTLSELADAFIEMGQPQDAITALEEAGQLLADSPDQHSRGRALARFGRAHELTGDLETAAGYLRQAARALHEAGSARGEADALVALGDLADRAGRREEARTRYAEAQRVLVSIGLPEGTRVRERLAQLDAPGQAESSALPRSWPGATEPAVGVRPRSAMSCLASGLRSSSRHAAPPPEGHRPGCPSPASSAGRMRTAHPLPPPCSPRRAA
jgi:tetratricopeptide (TPR) repeat protein